MPYISTTVFDDLPESIITQEIFLRLTSRDILRCGAVSKSWRCATSNQEFLRDHHQRQPLLPLVIFSREDSVDAFDINEAPAKRQPILRYKINDNVSTLGIHASCDGLLLLSLLNGRINVVNPTTGQWLALPRLTGACWRIAGMYPHRSGEYRVLYRMACSSAYYILTVGSCQNQKPKRIGPLPAPVASMRQPSVLLNGCLHWLLYDSPSRKHNLLIFDTVEETFRLMSLPATATPADTLLMMEGTLGMRCLDNKGKTMEIWLLQDYERETWSKFQSELPMVTYWSHALLSHKKDMLIYYKNTRLHQLHYDDNGMVLEEFQWDTNYPNITDLWYKESLIRHAFFPRRANGHVSPPRFFWRL